MTAATMNRARPGRTRGLLFLAGLGILAIALVALFSRGGESSPTTSVGAQEVVAVPVQAAEVKTGPIRSTLTYSGNVDASHQVSIAARTSGQVLQRPVDVGSVVRAGDPLVVLDSAMQRAQLRQAEAAVAAAQARSQSLTGSVKPTDIEAARSGLAAAEQRYNQLVFPTEAARKEADAAVSQAEAAVENARGAVERTQATLRGQVWLYCDQYLKFALNCGDVTIPLSVEDIRGLEDSLGSRFTDPNQFLGQRTIGVLEANGAHVAALAGQETARTALEVAKTRRQTLLSPTAADLAAARSGVDQARAGVEKALQPYSDGDLAGVQAGIAQASAAADLARIALEDTTIRAPFEGVVASVLVEVGGLVNPGVPVVSLVANDIEVALTVDEARLNEIKAGVPAELTVGAYPGRVFKARVASVAPTGDARTHTFEIKVRADDPERLLKPGMYAAVTIVTAQKEGALLVPAQAMTTTNDGKPAVLVIRDNKATLRPVTPGLSSTDSVEIVQGLTRGEQVVVVGQGQVRDGQAVSVRDSAAR